MILLRANREAGGSSFPLRLFSGTMGIGKGECQSGITKSVALAFADEMPIPLFSHPAGAGQMAVMYLPATFRFFGRIEAEQNLDGLLPICAIALCI